MAEKTGVIEVSASKKVDDEVREGTGTWDVGNDINEFIELYGAELTHDLAIRSGKIKMQSQMRADLEAGTFDEAAYQGWRVDEDRTPSRDPKAQIVSGFNKLSADEREALIAQLKASL